MNCPKCDGDNREGVRFCEERGAKMEINRPSCAAIIRSGKKLCGECGHRLSIAAGTERTDYTRPSSYTPKCLQGKIIATRSAIQLSINLKNDLTN